MIAESGSFVDYPLPNFLISWLKLRCMVDKSNRLLIAFLIRSTMHRLTDVISSQLKCEGILFILVKTCKKY